MRTASICVAAFVLVACAEEDLAVQDAGGAADSGLDAGAPDSGSLDAGFPDASPPALCSNQAVGATLTSAEGEHIASVPWYTIVAEYSGAAPREMISVHSPSVVGDLGSVGGVWLATPAPIPDETPTATDAIVVLEDLDQGHPLCGSATVTWDYGSVEVELELGEVSRLPTCDEGVETSGEVNACSASLDTECSGGYFTFESTVDGFEAGDPGIGNYRYIFGGTRDRVVMFKLPGVRGIADFTLDRGYAVFDRGAPSGTLFCFTGINWQPGDENFPATLRLSGFKLLGTCPSGQSVPEGSLQVCIR